MKVWLVSQLWTATMLEGTVPCVQTGWLLLHSQPVGQVSCAGLSVPMCLDICLCEVAKVLLNAVLFTRCALST